VGSIVGRPVRPLWSQRLKALNNFIRDIHQSPIFEDAGFGSFLSDGKGGGDLPGPQ
jgi:hypothetical protein